MSKWKVIGILVQMSKCQKIDTEVVTQYFIIQLDKIMIMSTITNNWSQQYRNILFMGEKSQGYT